MPQTSSSTFSGNGRLDRKQKDIGDDTPAAVFSVAVLERCSARASQ
jgi:hypothetical protein